MKLDFHSMGVKLWMYFALFSVAILTTLWLLQSFSLSNFYEGMKTNDISRTAEMISTSYGRSDFESIISEIAYRRALLIFVTDMDGNIIFSAHNAFRNPMDLFPIPPDEGDGMPSLLPWNYDEFLVKLDESEAGYISYTVSPDKVMGTILIYGLKLPDAVLYISAPLDPMDSTTDILKTQLIYAIISALLLSVFIAFFISKKLSRPIARITATARGLAGGDYDVHFTKGDYSEIDELSDTLNYATTELSKVEKLRRELIANISHDFRTPLTMVKAYTEMIRDISGENKEKRDIHLGIIKEEADRLGALVDEVLELSLIQSGNEKLNLSRLDVSELLNNTLKRFMSMAEPESPCLQSEISPDLYAIADALRLEQVLYNLIGNALKHNEGDKPIRVRLMQKNNQVRFEVTDEGRGIPTEELNMIWERYHKTAADGDINAGTGLGLAIVKGILELHGAEFGVESEVGFGSTFWFEIAEA